MSDEEHVNQLRVRAVRGEALAQHALASIYENGSYGVNQDLAKAFKWYRSAAEQDFSPAFFELSCCYAMGRGVEESEELFTCYCRKAAEAGYAEAEYMMGELYYNGYGQRQESFEWYEKAAKNEHMDAQYKLGVIYLHGDFVVQDFKSAAQWLRMAAIQGKPEAQYNLAMMHEKGDGVLRDYKKAAKWYRMAADQGDRDAQNNLGALFEYGNGVEKNYGEALRWYQQAAEQEDSLSCNNIGRFHENGLGVERNLDSAERWYRKAAMLGHRGAKERMDSLIQAKSKGWNENESENDHELEIDKLFGSSCVSGS